VNERGQIFTLDMFFALTLTVLVVSYSGLALEQARRQADAYALRYSLERTANDAADALVKTLGRPSNWEENTETLETLGFAEENGGKAVRNILEIAKFGQLRRLANYDNWDAPVNANAVKAIKEFFGGSENFEITIFDENGNEMWNAWPRWKIDERSDAENALEVVVVRRSVVSRYGTVRYGSGDLLNENGGRTVFSTDNFEILPGELEAFDWYVILLTNTTSGLPVEIYVNIDPNPPPTHKFNPPYEPEGDFWPDEHGGMDEYLNVGTNIITAVSEGKKNTWAMIYLVAVPACSMPENARLALSALTATLEVKLWR